MTIITGILLVATGMSMFDQLAGPSLLNAGMHQCAVMYEGDVRPYHRHHLRA